MRDSLRKCRSGSGRIPRGLLGSQRGVSLIEVLVAVAILGIVATSYLSALVSSSRTQMVDEKLASAAHLAESQMEYIMDQPYADSYDTGPIANEYAGYSVAITVDDVDSRDANIQKIGITVSHNGKPIIMSISDNCTLAGYKKAE